MKLRILGIDPGTDRVGYGVIEKAGMNLKHVESGLLPIPAAGLAPAEKLLAIEAALRRLTKRVRPDLAGVEKLFFTKNKKTAIRVAEARGVILKTLAQAGVPLVELSPGAVKVAVTSDGRADKQAVAKMTNLILKIPPRRVADDVTDALAIAVAAAGSFPQSPN